MFPFTGIRTEGEAPPGVPMLPMRFRKGDGTWSRALNAVLDTGSTRCLLTVALARGLGIAPGADAEELKGAGGAFRAAPSACDARIVDAHYPDATFWEVADLEVWVPVDEGALEVTVVGWDLLRLFDLTIRHRKGRIDLHSVARAPGSRQPPQGSGPADS